jgi:hypothetical protein
MARFALETSLEIPHPPEAVWAVLTDFASFARWNPFVIEAAGEPVLGSRLSIKVRDPRGNGSVIPFRPVVTTLEPGKALAWTGRLLVPGLFDGEHWYRLEPTAGGTLFRHGENFGGLVFALTGPSMVEAMRPGFAAMNAALAAEVARRAAAAG